MQNDISVIQRELDVITKVIVDTVPVETIYLFGSYAYGIPHTDSDLDLYVVFRDDLPIRELDAIFAIHNAVAPFKNMPLDVIGLKLNQFLDRKIYATLERKIAREGVKLYG
jgi:predicted nucleotidyltransferase